jgi:hypothetical protein
LSNMPKAKKRRLTRQASEETFGGGPCELQPTDPSTYRQLIQYYYYLIHTQPGADVMFYVNQTATELKSIWSSVNPRLPLITDKSINRKLKDLFCLVKDINRHHGKASQKENLDANLDKLFDISACCCLLETVACSDSRVKCKKQNCCQEHILCICPANAKVPIEDRAYLRDQRLKTGVQGAFQMSSVDPTAARRDAKLQQLKTRNRSSESETYLEQGSQKQPEALGVKETSSSGDDCDEWQPDNMPVDPYSLVKFPRYAMELVRGECSSTLGAALGNALLHDIRHLLRPEVDVSSIMMDKCKLDRAKAKVRVISEGIASHEKTKLICVGIDGKVDDNTLTYSETTTPDQEVILKKCVTREHHLTFTSEDGQSSGEYLTHRVIPTIGATGEVLAQVTLSVLQEYNSEDSILAVLVDNTAANTGAKNGLVVNLERKLGRSLHTVGCSLHQNELPLRALFKNLDGEAIGPTTFTGPLGKRCKIDIHNNPQVSFEKVETLLIDGFIPSPVLKDLSSDQRLLYEYCKGIGCGRVDEQWSSRKIGPLNHARWLTLAIRILCLYTRDNKPTCNLKKLVHYIVRVYAPAWFEIKMSSKLHESPPLLFDAIMRLNLLPYDDVKGIIKHSIQGNAYCLLPENFLYAMVKSDDVGVRNIALNVILTNRKIGHQQSQKNDSTSELECSKVE